MKQPITASTDLAVMVPPELHTGRDEGETDPSNVTSKYLVHGFYNALCKGKVWTKKKMKSLINSPLVTIVF